MTSFECTLCLHSPHRLDKLQFGESYFDAACRWLLANGDWWPGFLRVAISIWPGNLEEVYGNVQANLVFSCSNLTMQKQDLCAVCLVVSLLFCFSCWPDLMPGMSMSIQRWRKWIPDKTKCFARYGLYNPKEDARMPSDRVVWTTMSESTFGLLRFRRSLIRHEASQAHTCVTQLQRTSSWRFCTHAEFRASATKSAELLNLIKQCQSQ